jgi:hypothetical protein
LTCQKSDPKIKTRRFRIYRRASNPTTNSKLANCTTTKKSTKQKWVETSDNLKPEEIERSIFDSIIGDKSKELQDLTLKDIFVRREKIHQKKANLCEKIVDV